MSHKYLSKHCYIPIGRKRFLHYLLKLAFNDNVPQGLIYSAEVLQIHNIILIFENTKTLGVYLLYFPYCVSIDSNLHNV